MPEQKYKQKGGKYVHTEEAEAAFKSAFDEKIKQLLHYDKDTPPTIKTAWAEKYNPKPVIEKEEIKEKKSNIKFSPPDEKIREYGINYNGNNITSINMELLYADRNKLYGITDFKRENLMTKHNEFIKKDDKIIKTGIQSYIQHVVNIYNHYVPLRTQLFPEYAKHIPEMTYKIKNETDGETKSETKSEKNQKRKDTENILKTIMTMFSEVSDDGKVKTVIEQLHDFIVKEGDDADDAILGRYGETVKEISNLDNETDLDLGSKLEQPNVKVDNLFKILTVFAWEKSGKIMEQYEKSLKDQEEKEKEKADIKAMQEVDEQERQTKRGGSNELTKSDGERRFTLSEAQRAYRRRAVFLCFLSFVWNSWLLFSTLFSVYSFMTRILDLRQDYIDRGIGDFGETESGNIFFSWFTVMQEIFTIGIVEMTTNIAQRSVTMAQSLANNTIDSLRYQNHLSWERGFAIYVNDLMSGVLTWSAGVSGEMNFQRSVNELMFEIRQTGLDLRTHAYSINNAITNSIGGMSATTMVLLRVLYPEEVPQMSTSTSVMLNITSNWIPFVGPIVSSIANSAYVGYTLYDLHTRHGIHPLQITQESLSTLLEQLQNTPADIRLLYNGLYRRPVLAIENDPTVADAPTGADTDNTVPDPNTNGEGGSRGKKRSYKKGRKGKQVKKNRSYRRK